MVERGQMGARTGAVPGQKRREWGSHCGFFLQKVRFSEIWARALVVKKKEEFYIRGKTTPFRGGPKGPPRRDAPKMPIFGLKTRFFGWILG